MTTHFSDDLPWMGRAAARALLAAGVTSLSDAAERSERELAALHGVGPKAIGILRDALARADLAFRDDG